MVVTGVGQHQMFATHFLTRREPRTFITSGGAGTMGFCLPAAVGAALAKPGVNVWAVDGDGSLQMTVQELGTLANSGAKVIVVVMDNGYLGMVRQWQTLFFDGRYAGTPMQSPDFGQIAKAYGIPYQKVTELDQVDDAIRAAADHDGAYVLEFDCDPSEVILPMIPAGGGFGDMIVKRPGTE